MAIKIYIDQGHNPKNPNAGAEGNGLREQDIVYKIGIELAELLEKSAQKDDCKYACKSVCDRVTHPYSLVCKCHRQEIKTWKQEEQLA